MQGDAIRQDRQLHQQQLIFRLKSRLLGIQHGQVIYQATNITGFRYPLGGTGFHQKAQDIRSTLNLFLRVKSAFSTSLKAFRTVLLYPAIPWAYRASAAR